MPENVNKFADIVVQYCRFIDHRNETAAGAFVRECARLLGAIFSLAVDLPDVHVQSTETLPDVVSREVGLEIARDVRGIFGDCNIYWSVFDPLEIAEPVAGDLSDDLTSIYTELLEGLTTFRVGSEEQRLEAVWHWKFGFEVHWGKHLVAALGPIQSILTGHLIDE